MFSGRRIPYMKDADAARMTAIDRTIDDRHPVRPPSDEARRLRRRRARCSRTLAQLWPYIWPSDRARPASGAWCWATVLLLVAKLATIAVPFTFKWAADALTGQGSRAGRGRLLARSGSFAAPIADDARLWRHAHPDGAC